MIFHRATGSARDEPRRARRTRAAARTSRMSSAVAATFEPSSRSSRRETRRVMTGAKSIMHRPTDRAPTELAPVRWPNPGARVHARVAERDPRSRPGARADLVHETFAVKGDRSRIQATPSTNVRALRYAPPRPRVIPKCHRSRLRTRRENGAQGAKGKMPNHRWTIVLVDRVDRVESAKTRSKTVLTEGVSSIPELFFRSGRLPDSVSFGGRSCHTGDASTDVCAFPARPRRSVNPQTCFDSFWFLRV